ncbi:MAG TPA: hypothetical protein VIC08_13440 [Cellvibrionaceae bacterium]
MHTAVGHFVHRVASWDIVNVAVGYNGQTDTVSYRDTIFLQKHWA